MSRLATEGASADAAERDLPLLSRRRRRLTRRRVGSALAPFAAAAASSWFVPTSPNWVNVENANVLQNMLVQIFTGQKSVKSAAASASAQITRILNAS